MLNYVSERFLLSLLDKDGEIKRPIMIVRIPGNESWPSGRGTLSIHEGEIESENSKPWMLFSH